MLGIPRFALVATVVLLGAGSAGGTILAQEASPAASPSVVCEAPVLMPGTPVVAGLATPDAMPAATPEMVGVPADPELVIRVTDTAVSIVACLNAGEHKLAVAWLTPEALSALFGTADFDAAAAKLEGFPRVEIVAVEDVRVLPDGRARAEVTYSRDGELRRAHTYWAERHNVLLLDGAEVLSSADGTPVP